MSRLLIPLLALLILGCASRPVEVREPPLTPLARQPDAQTLIADIPRALAFWHDHAVDREQGGYRTAPPGEPEIHRLTLSQARLIWVFAEAHARGHSTPQRDYLAAARHGVTYLTTTLRDPATGAARWAVTPQSHPLQPGIDLYTQAFAAFALANYARAANDPAALNEAETLLRLVDTHLRDPVGLGWQELARGNWQPVTTSEDAATLGGIARPPLRSANAQMHVLLAANELLRARPDSWFARDLLARAHRTVTTHFYPLDPAQTHEWLTPAGRPADQPDPQSLGHLVEVAWWLADAERRLDRPVSDRLQRYLAYADRYAADGLLPLHPQTTTAPTDPAIWWVQAERIAAAAWAQRHADPFTPDNTDLFLKRYTRHQIDPATAIPRTIVTRDGETLEGSGPTPWKAAYHDLRMRWLLADTEQPSP